MSNAIASRHGYSTDRRRPWTHITAAQRRIHRATASCVERLEDRRLLTGAGLLDPAFGSGGLVTTATHGIIPSTSQAVVLEADGRSVVAGTVAGAAGAHLGIMRYNVDGSPDTTFGTAGSEVSSFVITDYNDITKGRMGLAIDAAGRILVSSETALPGLDGTVWVIARYNPDGSPDTTLNGTGFVTLDPAATFRSGQTFYQGATALGVDSQGRIIATGFSNSFSGPDNNAVARFQPDGSLDTTFGNAGLVLRSTGLSSGGSGVLFDALGRILVDGSFGFNGTGGVMRLNSNGSLDTTFGSSGVMGGMGTVGMAKDSAGGFVIGGEQYDAVGSNYSAARLNPDGTPDTSFGVNGVTRYTFAGQVLNLCIDGSGRIVQVGYGQNGDVYMSRLLGGGSLDASFGSGGVVTYNVFAPVNVGSGEMVGACVSADGTIYVAGESTALNASLLKFNSDGSRNLNFGSGGSASTTFTGVTSNSPVAALSQPDGKLVVLSNSAGSIALAPQPVLTRYNANGSLDTTFGSGGQIGITPSSGLSPATAFAADGSGGFFVAGGGGPSVIAHVSMSGDLESNFGNNGFSSVGFSVQALSADQNGRPVVTGDLVDTDGMVFAVARLLINGQYDASFGTGGIVTTPFLSGGPGTSQAHAHAVTVDATNRPIVVGEAFTSSGYTDFAVARYNVDGTLDTSFGGGTVITDFGGLGAAAASVTVTNGEILVGGTDRNFDGVSDYGSTLFDDRIAMARYQSNGTLDSTFADHGRLTTADANLAALQAFYTSASYPTRVTGQLSALAVDSQGRIVAGGGFSAAIQFDPQSDFDTFVGGEVALVRYNPDGTQDLTFGDGGFVNTTSGSPQVEFDVLSSLAIGGNGDILALGRSNALAPNLLIAGYSSDSPIDPATIATEVTTTTLTAIQSSSSEPIVSFQATTNDQVQALLTAISSVSVDGQGPTVNIVLNEPGLALPDQVITVPDNVVLTINGANGTTITGNSPALVIASGTVVVTNVTLTTSTNSPTIIVQGGSLTLRDCTVLESDQYNQAAIEVDGGTVDLGTASDPGNNIITARGGGSFVRNLTNTPISAVDDTFLSDATVADQNLQGLVWVDFNNDGFVDFGEQGIDGVTITLTGTDDLGDAITLSTVTANGGVYSFNHIRPGNYSITEGTVPVSYLTGKDAVGTLGGNNPAYSLFSTILVGVNQNGFAYNFGQQPAPGSAVAKGQAAGIGFWANKNGQALIAKFTGTDTGNDPRFNGLPKLSSWLAEAMPNLFGSLIGMTPQQVAAVFLQKFVLSDKLDAQVMATALNAYATDLSLAGTAASYYGFSVTQYGLGNSTWNVGSDGAAFGVYNNSTLTVMQILQDWDKQTNKSSTSLRKLALDAFGGINSKGGV